MLKKVLVTFLIVFLSAGLAFADRPDRVTAANNTGNYYVADVVGNKSDTTAAGVVTTTDSLVAYIKQLVTADIAGTTALGVIDEFHDVPAADNVLNAQINEVIGNKTDAAAAGAVTTTDTLVGYIKQLVTAAIAETTYGGDQFFTLSTVVSSGIPNNTQTAGAITGAASGAVVCENIVVQCDATGWAAPTNIEITTDNAAGLTGAGAPVVLDAIAAFGANSTTVLGTVADTKIFPFVLETTKKLYIHGDNAAGTGAGSCNVYIQWRRLSDASTIAAANIAAP